MLRLDTKHAYPKTWDIRLFGRFRLIAQDGTEFQSKGKRHKLLLALLALSKNARCGRRELGGNLFEETELPTSPNLSLLLNRLTQAMRLMSEERVLIVEPHTIGLDLDLVAVDLIRFQNAIASASREFDPSSRGRMLAQGLELCEGDLLPDLDHPVITPIREQVRALVLKAALDLSRSPAAAHNRELILRVVRPLEHQVWHDPQLVGDQMKVYYELGLKEEMVKTFTEYEAWLSEELGEPPGEYITDLFHRLAVDEASSFRTNSAVMAPKRPAVTLGRADLLRQILEFGKTSDGGSVLTLVGLSGIGKSHLLAEAFWLLNDSNGVQLIDYEQVSGQALIDRLSERPAEVLMLDHAHLAPRELLTGLLDQHPQTRLVLATHSRTGIPDEVIVPVTPLNVASGARPGAAVELLKYHTKRQLASGFLPEIAQESSYAEIAMLCDGIPLALEITGKLLATIGFRATLQMLKEKPSAVAIKGGTHERHSSVAQAIRASYGILGSGAKRLVTIMAAIGTACHAGLLLEAVDCPPEDLQEAFLSGLIRRSEDAPLFSILDSVAFFVRSAETPLSSAETAEVAAKIGEWFQNRAQELPIDLTLAASLSASFWAIDSLRTHGLLEEALALLACLKPWIGSERLGDREVRSSAELLADNRSDSCEAFPGACLSLGAIYFHANLYKEMAALLTDQRVLRAFEHAPEAQAIHREMQIGLANRALELWEPACSYYERAIEMADRAGNKPLLVGSHHNLATMLETLGRADEALEHYMAASQALSIDTDVRLQNLVNSSIARMKHLCGHDLEEVCAIYEATLMHAMEQDDRRIAAEILQNLGAAYADRSLMVKAGFSTLIGTALLLDFGYTPAFRRLARSSLPLLGCCLYNSGERDLAFSVRVMVDRLGDTPIYQTAKKWMTQLEALSYTSPSAVGYALASEAELTNLLRSCGECLDRPKEGEVPLFLEVGRRYADLRLA